MFLLLLLLFLVTVVIAVVITVVITIVITVVTDWQWDDALQQPKYKHDPGDSKFYNPDFKGDLIIKLITILIRTNTLISEANPLYK